MRRRPRSVDQLIFCLTLLLEDVFPAVTREVEVGISTKLGGLHRVIQAVMGWQNLQDHRFILKGDIYERVPANSMLDPGRERNWRLDSAFYPAKFFYYQYGLDGNGWLLRIIERDVVGASRSVRYPRCIAGEGTSPPDEICGPNAYRRYLQNELSHSKHNRFSIVSANRRIDKAK